jgi:hypothetical protein
MVRGVRGNSTTTPVWWAASEKLHKLAGGDLPRAGWVTIGGLGGAEFFDAERDNLGAWEVMMAGVVPENPCDAIRRDIPARTSCANRS